MRDSLRDELREAEAFAHGISADEATEDCPDDRCAAYRSALEQIDDLTTRAERAETSVFTWGYHHTEKHPECNEGVHLLDVAQKGGSTPGG